MTPRRRRWTLMAPVLSALCLLSCAPPPPAGEGVPGRPLVPPRIVAIGDVHGDLMAAQAALRLAGATNGRNRWIGGDLVVVQTGDILDRGDGEREILDLFGRLQDEARRAGGAVHLLNGNHELMNSYLDFRYVTEGGLEEFGDMVRIDPADSLLATLEPEERVRGAAFRPGGPMAMKLAGQPTALVIGPNVFVHGGVLPYHVEMGLDSMNRYGSELAPKRSAPTRVDPRRPQPRVDPPLFRSARRGRLRYAWPVVLEGLGVERMVVGHTVQRTGITAFCGGRVWCVDVGISAHYEGRLEVLEIRGNVVRSLR